MAAPALWNETYLENHIVTRLLISHNLLKIGGSPGLGIQHVPVISLFFDKDFNFTSL